MSYNIDITQDQYEHFVNLAKQRARLLTEKEIKITELKETIDKLKIALYDGQKLINKQSILLIKQDKLIDDILKDWSESNKMFLFMIIVNILFFIIYLFDVFFK